MDTSKIIKGVVNSGRYTVTAPIVKEDYGLYLQIEGVELPSTYEVDFSNSEHNGTSVTMIGNSDGVLIPHQFIDTGKDVFAFLYHVGIDYGKTVYKFRIPNKVRPDRTEETPTPEQASVIDQAISALNEAVEQTAQDVESADASAQSAREDADRAEQAKEDASTFAQRSANSAQASADYSASAQASATASAQSASQSAQIKSDVQGMVSDAQGYAESASQSASASAQSASDAHGYAQSASASAQSASGYASNAQTSANTASAKAQDASTSAQTASTKATEASQSATNASASATQASGYATSAQTAQGLAESARDSAQGYAEDAQGYANDAQASAESISASASQIAKNTSDIASLEDDRYKAFVTDSASGSIASFPDGADGIPLKSLVVNIDPVQDLSNGDPSPENICPISGWTGANVWADGKNLLDPTLLKDQGEWNTIRVYAPVGTRLTMSTNNSNVTTATGLPCYFKRHSDNQGSTTLVYASHPVTRIVYDDGYVEVVQRNPSGTLSFNDFQWQIEIGSTPTPYEPYNGTTLPVSWQTEAGTVYGGKLDVLSGVMTVERVAVVYDGTETYTNTYFPIVVCTKALPIGTGDGNSFLCSHLPTGTYYANFSSSSKRAIQFGHCDTVWNVASADELKAKIAEQYANGTPVTFVYPLAEPIEIQLTPQQVNSLLGVNNIWADTGDCSVEYRADTKLYIEKLTQPEEDDMVANSAIASGQFFMIGNTLYRALANIASGATITVGTNAQRVSLSDALNLVNA